MATPAVISAMNGDRILHPFFTKPNGTQQKDEETTRIDSTDDTQDDTAQVGKNAKKRKPKTSVETAGKTQKTLQEIVNPKSAVAQDCSSEPQDAPSTETVDAARSKRRRTSQTESVEVGQRQQSPEVLVPASSPLLAGAPEDPALEAPAPAPKTPPKKMLRLTASGKFSSPISKHSKDEESTEPVKKRGRPKKSKEVEKKEDKHLVVIIKHKTSDMGKNIERILTGDERYAPEVKVTPKKQRTPRKQRPAKPTHPFFLEKPKEPNPSPKKESPRKTSAVTPGKLRRKTLTDVDRMQAMPDTTDVWTSALLKDRLMMKHPGAKEPAWPSKDSAHVRGLEGKDIEAVQPDSKSLHLQVRKRKAVKKPLVDPLVSHFASQLSEENEGRVREDGFREPHPALRLPQKRLISGEDIARRVVSEVCSVLQNDFEDELSKPTSSPAHTALQKLYDWISSSMTAFDEGRGENLSWTQKYAPSSAVEVIQPSKQMTVLKEWLTSLTVTAVEGTSKPEPKTSSKSVSKPKKKRRRKNEDLDDFLVGSDEEINDMDEITDPEDVPATFNGRKMAKSVVQVAGDGVKLSNALLLSGPHGCGKTAASYAVAKELGFKVFEISSCEKRSGKDVLEKVGDMAENHLVKHHGTESGELSSTEEPSRNDEAFERDLASGRQGKIGGFFKPQARVKKPSPKKTKPVIAKENALEALQKISKKPAKVQQQSLILLEEVDVLFKDDKDFWTTVLKLIATSKRPFIMTCNDEDIVPLQAMTLHAILRFSPPPLDLATDHLLLIAAAEGHLLKRDAVSALYQSKNHDLRASIAELDLWCQMGIGDPRGGLGWIYQRFPPGSDLDEHGRRLRVVSQDTYQSGMGHSPESRLDVEDQMLHAWQEFDLSPTTLLGWRDMSDLQPDQLPTLKKFSSFADALSATDVFSSSLDTPDLDTTQKPMKDKSRSQYIEGMALLQTDERINYSSMTRELAVASTLEAFHCSKLATAKDVPSTLRSCKAQQEDQPLTRRDFACFDAISVPPESSLSSGITFSAFDGPFEAITTDLAPYVRSIVQFDAALASQRTNEGRNAKRARTTRAARGAVEGSQRATVRREKWFGKALDEVAVLATGGIEWPRAALPVVAEREEGTETPVSSLEE